MSSPPVVCASCGAAAVVPVPGGFQVCNRCGSRFSVAPYATSDSSNTILIVVIVGVITLAALAVVGFAGALFWVSAADPLPIELDAAPVPVEVDIDVDVDVDLDLDLDLDPDPEASGPATAAFEFHGSRKGYKESFYALGYVTNTSSFTISKPEIIAVLKDESGKEVGTDNGFAADDVIKPGERSPCSILIKDPPPHASIDFEVSARKAMYEPQLVEDLRLEVGNTKDGIGGPEVDGKVFNDSDKPARFVEIRVIGFDSDDKIVGIHSTYAKAELLVPGASARWKTLGMSFSTPPARLDYSVRGRVAD